MKEPFSRDCNEGDRERERQESARLRNCGGTGKIEIVEGDISESRDCGDQLNPGNISQYRLESCRARLCIRVQGRPVARHEWDGFMLPGKRRQYFSIVENRRVPDVFDEQEQRYTALSLFPDDREIPADAVDSVQVKLSSLELRRPRIFGHCRLACELWQQLGLDEFWQARLPEAREAVSWEKMLRLLVVNRLLDTGSEFHQDRKKR